MTADYYATLGVAPTTEDVVIRAAYLALMRRYHPDTNTSPAAAARVRAITAAYEVLSDRDKRADYDRRRADPFVAGRAEPQPRQFRAGPFVFAAIMLLLVPLLAVVIRSPPSLPQSINRPAQAQSRETPASIRDPNRLRGSSPPPVARPIAMAEPMPRSADDLAVPPKPPAQAPAQVRPSPASPPVVSKPPSSLPRPGVQAGPNPARPAPKPSRPLATSGQDGAAIGDKNLAALDRHVTLLHEQSWRYGDAAKRAALLRTRDNFQVRRDACRSDSCIRDAYLDRMREVSAIMSGPPQP